MCGERHEVAVNQIQDATVDFAELQRSGISKLELKELKVSTADGSEHLIELESGPPLSGAWNILRNLASRNRGKMDANQIDS